MATLKEVMDELSTNPTSSVLERLHPNTKYTPLMEAIVFKQPDTITRLLDLKANVHVKHMYGDSAMMMACKQQDVRLFTQLVDYGAYIDSRNHNEHTPLMMAIMNRYDMLIPTILQLGGSVHKKDPLGNTPLMLAVLHNHSACIPLLLEYGSNPYLQSYTNYSSYERAVAFNHVNCIHVLMVLTDIRNQPLWYTMIESAIRNQFTDCLEELIRHGKPTDLTPFNMLLFYAIEKKYVKGVDLLFKYGASPYCTDWSHRTPIVWGAIHENKELLEVCLKYGAEINPINYSILNILCIYGNTPLVRYVISKGANINRVLKESTPLMEAARYGHDHLVHLLIQFGANVNVVNTFKETATDIALYTINMSCHAVLHDAQRLSKLSYTHDMLTEMFRITLPHETWVSALSKEARQKSCELLRASDVDEIACFIALFEGEDRVLKAFREGQLVHFSESWIRGLCRPLGNRMYRRNVISYLVHPRKVRHLFRQLTSAFSA